MTIGDQWQDECPDELAIRKPDGALWIPILNGQGVNEYGLIPHEQHIQRGRVLEPAVLLQEFCREIQSQQPRGS
jgi:hypothetical protein